MIQTRLKRLTQYEQHRLEFQVHFLTMPPDICVSQAGEHGSSLQENTLELVKWTLWHGKPEEACE